MRFDVEGRSINTATGGVDPDPSDPVALLIHGAGMDRTIWQLQTRFLAHRGVQTHAIDLPGHGRSDGPPLETIEEMGEFITRLVDVAGWSTVSLVGHSMGSFVALDAAARLGERAASMVLMGTAEAMPVHPQLLDDAAGDLPAAAALMAAWGHAKPAHVGLNPTPGMWMVGGARALVERSDPGVLAIDFAACAAYRGAAEAAATAVCPTTVIVGLGDKMTPAKAGRALSAHLADVELVELADTGHSMMTEAPRAVRSAILSAVA